MVPARDATLFYSHIMPVISRKFTLQDSYHRLTEYSEMTKLKLEANYRSKVIPLEHVGGGVYENVGYSDLPCEMVWEYSQI